VTRFDLATIGEAALRLSVPAGERFETAPSFDAALVGAEANVATALASLGWRATWASALPDSPFGRRVVRSLSSFGLDLSAVATVPGGRLGNHFVEYGSAPRPTRVHFDRAGSTFAQMSVADVAWDVLLDTRILHLTGISAAVSPTSLEIVEHAAQEAARREVTVSFDVNYRARLWDVETAAARLAPVLTSAQILFCSRRDAAALFDVHGSAPEVAARLAERFGARYVVVSDSDRAIGAWLDGESRERDVLAVRTVDRLGAGDGLAAGFLHGVLGGDPVFGLDAAVGVAALAMAQRTEQVVTTPEELVAVIAGAGDLDR